MPVNSLVVPATRLFTSGPQEDPIPLLHLSLTQDPPSGEGTAEEVLSRGLYTLALDCPLEELRPLQVQVAAQLLREWAPHLARSHGILLAQHHLEPDSWAESLMAAQAVWDHWTTGLPQEVACWVAVDAQRLGAAAFWQLLSMPIFRDLHLIVRPPRAEWLSGHDAPCWGWGCATRRGGLDLPCACPTTPTPLLEGVVLPELPQTALGDALGQWLSQRAEEGQEPVRLIPAEELHHQWEGLDRLFVVPDSLSRQGVRQLAGFRAAGGEVVEIEDFALRGIEKH